jgi:Flp pilus assembly protein TadG
VKRKSNQRGSTIIEFAVVASAFFLMLIAICAGAALYFTHNALVEATRRGARYAASQPASTPAGVPTPPTANSSVIDVGPSLAAIRNYTIYGNAAGTGTKLVNINPANVHVQYQNFGVGQGSVSVYVTGYTYNFSIPGINEQISMPSYRTTFAGESAGTCPAGACS